MFARISPLALTLAAGVILPASASAVTIGLNNGNSAFTAAIAGTSPTAQFSAGAGTDLNIVITGRSNSAGLDLTRGGGGANDGLGVDSTGTLDSPGLAGDNGNQIDFQNNNGSQVFAEGVDFSFFDDLSSAVGVNVLSVTLAELATGELVNASIGGTSFAISGGDTDDFTFTFAPGTRLNAGSLASFDAGNTATAFRVNAIDVEVIPEPASLALFGAGLALLAGRRRA